MPPFEPELRRLFPPPWRRPGLLAVAIRWRRELGVAGLLGLGVWAVGAGWTAAVVGIGGALAAAVPPLRRAALRGIQSTVVAHRARAGFVASGVGGRTGRLPWIVSSRGRGDGVILSLWLPAGVTVDDLMRAREVIAAACGAAEVQVFRAGPRQDRLRVVVLRPRWGWWGR